MQDQKHNTDLTAAETRVRNALIGFVAVVSVVATGIFGYLHWRGQDGDEEVVAEQPVAPPVTVAESSPQSVPVIPFTDITEEAGIDFEHVNGAYGERLMPETIGSGLAFLDYDNDGDQDLLLINSSYWSGHQGDKPALHALYANDGHGRFNDVTKQAGLAIDDYGMGVAVGDFDGDGWVDLYLANLGPNRLLRNDHGRFQDVTESAGVAGGRDEWGSSSAFFDYDNDGDLDLFVANYVKWSRKIDLEVDFRLTGLGRAYGAPNNFIGANNYLYRNDGGGKFTDVSSVAGIRILNALSNPVGKGLGVAPVDIDRDGWVDLLVGNDTVRNFLYHNRGNGSFEEVGAFEGIGFDRNGKATGAMGIDSGYFRNDSDLGIAFGNFANEMSSLFVTMDGRAPFADEAMVEGLGPSTRLALTFGIFFFDADLDGRLDLFQANGHLEHEINKVQPSQHYAQPAQLFWNCGGNCNGRFRPVKESGDLSEPMVGRGAVYADIDGDGDLDLAVLQSGCHAKLFRNDQRSGHHWLRLKLVGKGANRDAIGARIELTGNGITQYRQIMPARSYMSQVELPVTFGLGNSSEIDKLVIIWPDGKRQEIEVSQADRLMIIRQ